MSETLKKGWKTALTSIIEDLDDSQYNKMLEILVEIPKSQRIHSIKENMPQIIIEHYGEEESISVINDAMKKIPRKDAKVQDLLRPFVDKLEKENKGKKRKHETDSESEEEQEPATGFKKNNIVSGSESSDEEQEAAADQPKKCQSDRERNIQPWRKTIHDLKITGDLGKKAMTGKVVQKSGLRTYQTKKKVIKFFFYLGVADETASIKVMVYGRERYQEIKEGSTRLFKNVIMDENMMKVTKVSTISKMKPADIPEELELEARMLIYHQRPVCSIKEAKISADKTTLSVEGTITKIGSVKQVNLKAKWRKKERQGFTLEDDTGFIGISLWGDDIKQLRGISNGDFVRVTNVKTNCYFETVSLNSTDFTRIYKVQSAPVQNVRIEIIGITRANKMETELEAEFNGNVQTFIVASPLLEKVFGVKLNGDFEEKLLEKIPLSAHAEIQGNKINKITKK